MTSALARSLDQSASVTPEMRPGRVVAHFFALDTDGRIAWPFRHVRTDAGLQPQRWRFGRWVYSDRLRDFLNGRDDRFVEATPAEVEAWLRRQEIGWHR